MLYILADALIQSDLQEQLGLSVLLKGTSTDFSPTRLGDLTQRPFSYWPNAVSPDPSCLSLQYLCCSSLCQGLGSVCYIWSISPVLSGVLCEFKYILSLSPCCPLCCPLLAVSIMNGMLCKGYNE